MGVQGLKGVLRVKSFAANPVDIVAYGPLTDQAGARPLTLTVVGEGKGVVLCKAKGVIDRNGAEALVGTELFVPRSVLPAPEADEFYHADLVGLEAVAEDGEALGKVTALYDFGGGPLIEIAGVLYPFTLAVVPVVDIAGGRVVIRPPEETEAREGDPSEAPEDGAGDAAA